MFVVISPATQKTLAADVKCRPDILFRVPVSAARASLLPPFFELEAAVRMFFDKENRLGISSMSPDLVSASNNVLAMCRIGSVSKGCKYVRRPYTVSLAAIGVYIKSTR